ncbi:MAG: hypothetical protein AAF492_02445, partial [Verrucomicrobiota bacterium]
MSESIFKIGTTDVDADRIVREIQETVERKMADGLYADARIARAERSNLVHLKNEDEFLEFYIKCLRDAVFVDIGDFEIHERRSKLAPLLILLKKIIWKLLKFYTYRLWSQQNQVNGLLVTAIEGVDEKYAGKIKALEKRIEELENRQQDKTTT